jgi:hypothetical protein
MPASLPKVLSNEKLQELKYLGTKPYEELNNQITETNRMLTKLMPKLDTNS